MSQNQPLDRIYLTGYKSIVEMDLELRALNVLIGANGAGKTNFISLFTLLRNIMDRNLALYTAQQGGADALLHFGRQTTPQLEIKLTFGANGYECTLIPAVGDTFIFGSEQVNFHDKRYPNPYEQQLGEGHKETRLFNEIGQPTTRIARYVIQSMKSWRVYHFHDTSASAKVKQTNDLNDNAVLRADAGNLAAFLYRLQETKPQAYRRIVFAIRQVAPFFDNFILRPDPLNLQKIRLEWREKSSESYFSADHLSDGTLRFICLATLLLQPDLPATILIDEPELGLHPYAIVLLASLIRKAATRTQVIISTQSVPLVNQFQPEDIIVVNRDGPASTFHRLETPELETWLDDYGLGDLWEKNVIGGRPQ
ncbi:MAG: AAA family ATPase [Anaerolineales bacterium]|nr:AAA family ATPase [Anaerolineales bacterium]